MIMRFSAGLKVPRVKPVSNIEWFPLDRVQLPFLNKGHPPARVAEKPSAEGAPPYQPRPSAWVSEAKGISEG